MRFWSRLLLVAWLLAGLAAAPAMAFGMPCHRGMKGAVSDMPQATHAAMTMQDHGGQMHHQGKPVPEKSAFACLVHCLGVSGFVPFEIDIPSPPPGNSEMPHFRVDPLEGRSLGPPLEPPISLVA